MNRSDTSLRTVSRRRLRRRAVAALLLPLVAAVAASCGSEEIEPPEDIVKPIEVRADVALRDALEPMLSEYTGPDGAETTASFDGSRAILRILGGGFALDLAVLDSEAPVESLSNVEPIEQRLWIRDALVFIADKDDTRSVPDLFRSDDRFAMGVEAGPLGQFTRFGLRRMEMWEDLRSRAIRLSDASSIIAAVASGEAGFGVVYGSDAARAQNRVKELLTLEVSGSADLEYTLVAMTDRGVDLLRWLNSPDQMRAMRRAGYVAPDPPEPEPANRPGSGAERGRDSEGGSDGGGG